MTIYPSIRSPVLYEFLEDKLLAGHHNDRNLPGFRVLPYPAKGLPAVHGCHHDIQQDKVRQGLLQLFHAFAAARGTDHRVALHPQDCKVQLYQVAVVIYNKNLLRFPCGYPVHPPQIAKLIRFWTFGGGL